MSAGDVRRVEVVARVFLEHEGGEVREYAVGTSWTSAAESIARVERGEHPGERSLPIEPHEPLRLMRADVATVAERAMFHLCEKVSRERVALTVPK